jgi:hypothetical protein
MLQCEGKGNQRCAPWDIVLSATDRVQRYVLLAITGEDVGPKERLLVSRSPLAQVIEQLAAFGFVQAGVG